MYATTSPDPTSLITNTADNWHLTRRSFYIFIDPDPIIATEHELLSCLVPIIN